MDRARYWGFGTVTALLISTTIALADVVSGPPEDCPAGTWGASSHWGPYCTPARCPDSGECDDGKDCQSLGFCRIDLGTTAVVAVDGYCSDAADCRSGTCESHEVCVDPNISIGGAPNLGSATGGAPDLPTGGTAPAATGGTAPVVTGGASATGASLVDHTGGAISGGGAGAGQRDASADSQGSTSQGVKPQSCGCRVPETPGLPRRALLLALAAALACAARRRRETSRRARS
jgi:MYXO-CTERM domain-containing protein